MDLANATEAQAERAIATLKRAIDAAENSNQAGENFVVAAAAGPALLTALETAAARFEHCARMIDESFSASGTLRAERVIKAQHYALEARAAISKATSRQPEGEQ